MWKFHRISGKHISLENNCTTAKRLNPTDTYCNGICFTNTPLVNGKVYEIQVDELVTNWTGSLVLGVTTNIPSDLTEIHLGVMLKESWILGGYCLRKNGDWIDNYSLNLDKVQVGDKLGIMKASDSTLHFYLNGTDNGKAFSNLPEVVYGVVDLFGICGQVPIIDKVDQHTTQIMQMAIHAWNFVRSCLTVNLYHMKRVATKIIYPVMVAIFDFKNDIFTGAGAGAQVAMKKALNFSGRPADWNVQTVCEFIESIPNCAPYVEKFRSEQVNGAALLALDKKDLKEFFEMPL